MGLSCAQAQATASATAYNSERDHPLEIKPKFEILAPNHDFTKYNRRRNDVRKFVLVRVNTFEIKKAN